MPTLDVSMSISDSTTMSAVGPVATSVNRSTQEATEASYSITRQREAELTIALLEASTRAETDGWDGYHAEGVKTGSYISAEALLRVLPAYVPAPEVFVHPDGQIALDWTADRDHVFSISVSDSGTLSYAGLFGGSKVTGREVFNGTFPAAILPHVIRIADLM
jgi:hypothetical protein